MAYFLSSTCQFEHIHRKGICYNGAGEGVIIVRTRRQTVRSQLLPLSWIIGLNHGGL